MISERGWWMEDFPDEHVFDEPLAAALARLFAGKSVVDLGCGLGDYVRYFRQRSIRAEGYDGNPHTPAYNPDCKVLDLSERVDVGLFDWVLSLEVGEHIPGGYEAVFLDNIHRHNREGVVLSWAVLGQEGFGHFNVRDNAYIKEAFRKLGYRNDEAEEQRLRRVSSLQWFPNTLMVFRKNAPRSTASRESTSMLKVSCLCPTYNRAPDNLHLVEEAIESFLRQDYPNKELIVLNDTPGQSLRFDHPDVRIVNSPVRCSSLGDKRNRMASLATGELLCVWDDDDISLPWRLSKSVQMLGDAEYYNPRAYWFLDCGRLSHDHRTGTCYFASIYRKCTYEELGGTPDLSMGEDQAMHEKLITRKMAERPPLPVEEWYYIYRWGVSPVHLSSMSGDTFYGALGKLPIVSGEFTLEPHWEEEYTDMTRAYLFALQFRE
jgi:hypothetical protein